MTRLQTILAFLVFLAAPLQGWALSSDRDQPMNVEADRVELDDSRGISIYHGNVKITQGTLKLTGDRITVYNKGNTIQKVLIDGSPATYRQRPDNKDQDVTAQSLRMEYYTDPEHIILLKQAQVVQEGNSLSSERIEYDVVKDQVNAGTDAPNDRVRITIQPKTRKEKPDSSAQ